MLAIFDMLFWHYVTVAHLYDGILCRRQKEERIPTLWNSMDGTIDSAKSDKLVGERQVTRSHL